jgi:anti-sigma factor RsiW
VTQALITCRELIEFLDRYVDKELSTEERERFDRHLSVCTACVAYLHSYRETIRMTAMLAESEDPPPADVPEQLITAVLDARRRA